LSVWGDELVRRKSEWPAADELVMCTITKVFSQGAFLTLDEYGGKEGMVHLSEVASGWIKNIREFVWEGQKVVCKVLSVNPRKGHVDLSIRRVKETQRRWKIEQFRREQRAEKLIEYAASKLGKDLDFPYAEAGFTLQEKFGDLHSAFAVVVKNEKALEGLGLDGRWVEVLREVASSAVEVPIFKVAGYVHLSQFGADGIKVIKSAMIAARESVKDPEVHAEFYYVGSPRYRLEVTAPSYKTAEEVMRKIAEAAIVEVKKAGGKGEFHPAKKGEG